MRQIYLIAFAIISTLTSSKTFGQTELGLSRETVLALPFVVEYHKTNNYIPALEYDFMRVKSLGYHYTFGFSNMNVCNVLTLESRSYMSDIKLRDYLSMYGVPISKSTYIINGNDKKNRHYAFIGATHNGLPHQVIFSYRQMFKTEGTPRIDDYPYELNN